MKNLIKITRIKLIFCSLVATLAVSNANANGGNEDRYIVPEYNEYGLYRLSNLAYDFTSDVVSDVAYRAYNLGSDVVSIPSNLGNFAFDVVTYIPAIIICGGAVKIPCPWDKKRHMKNSYNYSYTYGYRDYDRMSGNQYQYQYNYPSQHEPQEVDDFELVNEGDTILCSKISCDRFLGKHKEGSAHNWDGGVQNQIIDVLADNEQLPKIKRRECYNDKKDNHLIYTIWNKDKFKNKFGTGGLDVIIDKRTDKDKVGQLFLTSFMWFANNTKAIDSEENETNTHKIKVFISNGLKNNYKLFKFPDIATKGDYNELQDEYLNKLRAVYLPQIDGVADPKSDEVAQLQSGFAKIIAQCIKDNPNNINKCQETAKGISDWLLYSKTGLFSSKSTNEEITLAIPALIEMRPLRDKIQEQQRYITSTNTTTATNLSKWVNQELYKTVLLYEFAPQNNSDNNKYCTSYSPQDLKCPIPPEIKQLDIDGKDILYNVSLPLGDSAHNLFSYVPDDSYKIVFTGASNENSTNEYKEEMKELILKTNDSIEIAMLTLPEKNTPTYKELVETFAELSKRLLEKRYKEVKVRIIYGPNGYNGAPQDYLKSFVTAIGSSISESSNIPLNDNHKLKIPLKIQLTKFASYSDNYVDDSLLWNKAKLIVIDGKHTNIGSTNLYEDYSNRNSRIKNISVTFDNNSQLAALVHKFMYTLNENSVISSIYHKNDYSSFETSLSKISFSRNNNFIEYSTTHVVPTKDPVNTIMVPQYGHIENGSSEIRNISEIAQVALVKAAKESIFISQSGIFPTHDESMVKVTLNNSKFNDRMLEAIREKVKSGIKITIVKSSDKSVTADDGSYDALSADAIKRILLLDDIGNINHNLLEVVEAKNSNGEYVPNHATMIIVDNKAAYVGSHPIYNASHTEYGFIIQDEKFTKKLLDGYIKTLEKS